MGNWHSQVQIAKMIYKDKYWMSLEERMQKEYNKKLKELEQENV